MMEQRKDRMTIENSSSILDEKETITRQDRSPLVRDHDYGRMRSANALVRDESTYAIIELDENDQIVYADYSKLDIVLNEVIANNIKDTHIKNPVTNEKEIAKTIQGNVLTKLKLSELEMEYAIDYLTAKNILVRGIDSSLDSEFDGYQYVSTYKGDSLPPALTKEQNTELFKKLKQLKLMISKTENLDEKKQLENEMYNVRNQLVEGNMRMANYLLSKSIPSSMNDTDKEDIKQIGFETLITFIDKYDVDKGYALSTGLSNYLMFKVWKSYNNTSDIIRVPVFMQERIKKILKVKKVIEPILGREATPEEISLELNNFSVKKIEEALQVYKNQGFESYDNLEEQKESDELLYDYSLDDDNIEIQQYIVTTQESLPELIATNEELKKEMNLVLNNLPEREADVLRLRYGFYDGKTHLLREIANIYGVSTERIRQIEIRALKHLRHPIYYKHLKGFYGDNADEHRYQVDNTKHKR